ncbi:Nn.00g033060.m01.CDS01 [Neocucurbitaria sp. VM-36]
MLRAIITLLQLRYALAYSQPALSHEVVNVTQSLEEFTPSPVLVNYTITELVQHTTTYISTEPCPASATSHTIYSIIFPSPDASPIEITAQSQVVTSYIPEMTWCVGPPIALLPITGPPYLNATTNYTTLIEGTGSCETAYAPLQTTVCATTLTGLASKVTVTDCDQEITFSTECGFTLETPTPVTTNHSLITPAPTVKRMFTYWLAPWQSLTAGESPADVDVKICSVLEDGELECIRYQEVWEVVLVTQTVTTERTIQFSTTVSGPGTLLVETLQTTITDTVESIDLSTILLLETEIEAESTSSGRKPVTTIRSTQEVVSTVYITKHLQHKSTSTSEPTTTVWVTSIATQRVGTTTVTRRRPQPRMAELVP